MTLINLEVLWSYLWRYAIIAAFFFGLGFMLGCSPQERNIVHVDEFVGSTRTEVIQSLGVPCFDVEDPKQKIGAIAWAAVGISPDEKTGEIIRCGHVLNNLFTCQTDTEGYVKADRKILSCAFTKGGVFTF